MQKKFHVKCATKFVGGLLLDYSEVMLNIFELSLAWEDVESWLVYADNLFELPNHISHLK